jgi:effector-binding domain-containing protein
MGLQEPTVVDRSDQHYVAITMTVPPRQLGEMLPPLIPELFDWLADHGVQPAGPAFWKYNVIDMATALEVEVGVPVDQPPAGDNRVKSGTLPGGRYVVASHVGHPDTLESATADLLAWADANGLAWDVRTVDGEERWTARLEEYLNGPDDQPDMNKWETNLVFRLAQ